MKKNATRLCPKNWTWWDHGAKVFINKGVNGRWTDMLPKEESDKYEKRAVEKLGE